MQVSRQMRFRKPKTRIKKSPIDHDERSKTYKWSNGYPKPVGVQGLRGFLKNISGQNKKGLRKGETPKR
jgi:hypothetical protein